MLKRRWLVILTVGVLLFLAGDQIARFTDNANYYPTLLVLGAFLVPVSFVDYFLEQEENVNAHGHVVLPTLLLCAIFGGLIGSFAAGTLEYTTLNNYSAWSLFWVGPIEEFAKLIVPFSLFFIVRKRFHYEMDGLIFGVAAGMAFAALETMGYGLTTLITSGGDLNSFDVTLAIRGLMSPAGHGAWTGLITAILWREQEVHGTYIRPVVIGVFLVAAMLHTGWDVISSINNLFIVIFGYLIIGGMSLFLLFRRLGEAKRSLALARVTAY